MPTRARTRQTTPPMRRIVDSFILSAGCGRVAAPSADTASRAAQRTEEDRHRLAVLEDHGRGEELGEVAPSARKMMPKLHRHDLPAADLTVRLLRELLLGLGLLGVCPAAPRGG